MYTVLRDSQEKEGKGWWWPRTPGCHGTIVQSLETGDYTINGYSHLLSIERKGSVGEWSKNITEKRFERELERLRDFKYAFIILEFAVSNILEFPVGSGIPKKIWKKIKVNGPYMLKRTTEIMCNYGIPVLFCGEHGKTMATSIFKRVIDNERSS
jgi:hypothetical protein